MKFEAATCATKGARDYQEDCSSLWPEDIRSGPADETGQVGEMLFAALADGMGGHAGGAIASRMICDRFMSAVTDGVPNPADLLHGLEAANAAVAEAIYDRPELTGMGATLIGASFTQHGMMWVSVGDSPLYLYRRGEVALLNEDHSLAPALDQLAREGKITEAQARQDPRRHMLRSAVTGEDLELIDVSKRPLQIEPGDLLLLASDGLNTLEQEEIARTVAAYANDGARSVAQALIRAVEDIRAPHQDNTTVIVVRPVV